MRGILSKLKAIQPINHLINTYGVNTSYQTLDKLYSMSTELCLLKFYPRNIARVFHNSWENAYYGNSVHGF